MFGYVVINKPELKFKEFDIYRGYYCGLCRSLKKRYGIAGQMTLTYDMTFLAMLLTGLYEAEISEEKHRCIAHPMSRHLMLQSKYTDYVADMNIILAYYKALDDWKDEHNNYKKHLTFQLQKFTKKTKLKFVFKEFCTKLEEKGFYDKFI